MLVSSLQNRFPARYARNYSLVPTQPPVRNLDKFAGVISEIDIWRVAVLMVNRYAADAEGMPIDMPTNLKQRAIRLVRRSGVGSLLRSSS